MKKKMVILLLTLGILGTAMGCGEKKDKTEDKEGTKTEQSSQDLPFKKILPHDSC